MSRPVLADHAITATKLLSVFLFLYAPFLNVRGTIVHLPYIVTAVLLGCFAILFLTSRVSSEFFVFPLLILVGYVWVLIVTLLNDVIDLQMHLVYINGLSNLLAAYALSYIILAWRVPAAISNGSVITFSIFVAATVHAAIMFLTFFVPAFASIVYSVVHLGAKGERFVDLLIRAPGLTTGGGDSLSVIQAIGLTFGLHHFGAGARGLRLARIVLYTAAFLLLVLSILLSARTGIVVVAVGAVVLLCRSAGRFLRNASVHRSRLAIAMAAAALCLILGNLGYSMLTTSEYGRLVNRAFEPFYTYMETGRVATTSSDHIIQTMYFLPRSDIDFLVGTGNFGDAQPLNSDVGYVRVIFGGGLIGVMLVYGALLYPLLIALRHLRLNADHSWLLAFLVITVLIVNVKVLHFGGTRESFKVLGMLVAGLLIGVMRRRRALVAPIQDSRCEPPRPRQLSHTVDRASSS